MPSFHKPHANLIRLQSQPETWTLTMTQPKIIRLQETFEVGFRIIWQPKGGKIYPLYENNYALLNPENRILSIDADTVPFPPFDLLCFSHGSPVREKIMSEITHHDYCCFTIGKAGRENKTHLCVL